MEFHTIHRQLESLSFSANFYITLNYIKIWKILVKTLSANFYYQRERQRERERERERSRNVFYLFIIDLKLSVRIYNQNIDCAFKIQLGWWKVKDKERTKWSLILYPLRCWRKWKKDRKFSLNCKFFEQSRIDLILMKDMIKHVFLPFVSIF